MKIRNVPAHSGSEMYCPLAQKKACIPNIDHGVNRFKGLISPIHSIGNHQGATWFVRSLAAITICNVFYRYFTILSIKIAIMSSNENKDPFHSLKTEIEVAIQETASAHGWSSRSCVRSFLATYLWQFLQASRGCTDTYSMGRGHGRRVNREVLLPTPIISLKIRHFEVYRRAP